MGIFFFFDNLCFHCVMTIWPHSVTSKLQAILSTEYDYNENDIIQKRSIRPTQ